jgi:hypothetical protein
VSDEPEDDDILTCWCGARGTADELFDDALFDEDCGGSGYLHCFCGGDLCVCHNHGEVECPGCPDCESDDDFGDEEDDCDD